MTDARDYAMCIHRPRPNTPQLSDSSCDQPTPSCSSVQSEWDAFLPFQNDTPVPCSTSRRSMTRSPAPNLTATRSQPLQGEERDTKSPYVCIFADTLIPGRGDPLSDAAVGICIADRSISFVGPQRSIPPELASAPRTHVRCLMPGLWDCHTHYTGLVDVKPEGMYQTHPATMGAAITRGLHDTLMGGVTSVRDVGSFVAEVVPLIEGGIILGPSVYAAGGAIGATGGSCDACSLPADQVYAAAGLDHASAWPGVGVSAIADGVDEVRRAVRLQLRRGAQCIKVKATGGVFGAHDNPLDRELSDAELRVAVEEAALHRRSVAAHAHGKEGVVAAILAGVATIEHGSYIDDEIADLMVEHGTALVATRNVIEAGLKNLDTLQPATARKMVEVAGAHARGYATAVRRGVKIALGTDVCGAKPGTAMSHGSNAQEVVWAVKVGGLTPLQAIEAGTINSAEILGGMAPKKGLVKVGWDADLIALDENPLDDVRVFADRNNIRYVWKGGDLVKRPGFMKLWP